MKHADCPGILIGGVEQPCAAPVLRWEETGLEFKVGRDPGATRRERLIDTIVLHWTGAENPPERVYQTLLQRKCGVEVIISAEGTVYQCCDPVFVDAHDCGRKWDRRSIGVEIVSYGFQWPPWARWSLRPVPAAGRSRRLLETRWRGRRAFVAAFHEEQIIAVKALVDALLDALPGIPAVVPLDDQGLVLDRPMTRAEERAWKGGVLGHLNITTRGKPDPGVPLLEEVAAYLGD